MTGSGPWVPGWLAALLDRVEADALLGDLLEEYHLRIVPERGPWRARLWFWKHALAGAAVGAGLSVRRRSDRHDGARPPTQGKPRQETMGTLFRDVQYAWRMVVRTPGISIVAVVTVALGVGVTTHTFSTVYGSVIRGMPFEDGQPLLHLTRTVPADGITGERVPIHDFEEWRAQQTVFEDLAGFYWSTVNLSDDDRRPERFQGAFVTANVFTEVGARPLLGRIFTPEEAAGRGTRGILLSHHVWTNRYAADSGMVGRSVRANGLATVVIGVMPEGFRFPFDHDVWLPLGIDASTVARGDGIWFDVVGRLRRDATLEGARGQMAQIATRLADAYPETNEGRGVFVQRYELEIMPPEITAVSYVMLAAVFGVLFIACANVANLLLARAVARSREVAVRSALGASRSAVIRLLLVEAAILALMGGVIGVGLGYVGVDLLNASIADIEKPYWIDVRMDLTALAFALGVTMLAAILSGIVPALKSSGADIGDLLKDQHRGSSGVRVGRFSSGLVVVEIALSCGLLIGAGMMIKSVAKLRTLDLGFDTEHVLTARVTPPTADYPSVESRHRFFDDLLARMPALPGVRAAALSSDLPALGTGQVWFGVEGADYSSDQNYPYANRTLVSPGFFEVFGVEYLEGRGFGNQDRADGLPVAVVNASFARRYLGDGSVLGRRFRMGRSDTDRPWRTVVGVVPDLHVGGGVGGLGSSDIIPEQFFTPLAQGGQRSVSIALHTAGPPVALANGLRDVVAAVDPDLPVYELRPMEEAFQTATWAFGLFGSLFSTFGVIALCMASVGLYGVMAFSVSRRSQEMGIRMALGASRGSIAGIVLRRGLRQLALGMGIGLALGAGLSRPMESVMFDVNASDLTVYLAIVLTLSTTGVLACVMPARRAARVPLADALRPD